MADSELLEKLAALRAANCSDMPTPEIAVLTRTINRLRREGVVNRCLQLGETAPDFSFSDANGRSSSLYEVLQTGPAILNFFRGYWCSYCRTELEAYESIQEELGCMGCAFFAISPQEPEVTEQSADGYYLIHDQDNDIARQFGIVFTLDQAERDLFASWGLFLDEVNGSWDLPIPATYIVKQDRSVGFAYIDVDFRARCCPDQLLDELKSFCSG